VTRPRDALDDNKLESLQALIKKTLVISLSLRADAA